MTLPQHKLCSMGSGRERKISSLPTESDGTLGKEGSHSATPSERTLSTLPVVCILLVFVALAGNSMLAYHLTC